MERFLLLVPPPPTFHHDTIIHTLHAYNNFKTRIPLAAAQVELVNWSLRSNRDCLFAKTSRENRWQDRRNDKVTHTPMKSLPPTRKGKVPVVCCLWVPISLWVSSSLVGFWTQLLDGPYRMSDHKVFNSQSPLKLIRISKGFKRIQKAAANGFKNKSWIHSSITELYHDENPRWESIMSTDESKGTTTQNSSKFKSDRWCSFSTLSTERWL